MTARYFHLSAARLLALGACSSRPREFVPNLQAPPADLAKYEIDYLKCQALVAQGQRSNFGARIASGGAGIATGLGVGAATMAGASSSMVGAIAAASTAMVAMPVVGIAAAWGVAKARKKKKEREVQEATALCLSEQGYQVAGGELARKRRKSAEMTH